MTRPRLLVLLFIVYAAGIHLQSRLSSQTPPPRRPPEELLRLSLAAEKPGLAEPFKGITANGQLEPGLFAIRSTGVSTAPVRKAAATFLSGLTPEQHTKTVFAADDVEWRKWMNQSFYVRQGVSFLEMSPDQREKAFGLLRASLSARGLKLTRDIMRLNETLGELTGNNFDEYGEWQYHITVMGQPSASEPWAWQFDGHHAVINYFVLGNQVVMTPFFTGSEPVVATSGKYRGSSILQNEQNRGLAMINALSDDQRKKAVLRFSKTGNDILTEAWKDNVVVDYAGIRANELTEAQRRQLIDLIALYVDNMDAGHARVKMDEVRKFMDRTWLAWIGDTKLMKSFIGTIAGMAMAVSLIGSDTQHTTTLSALQGTWRLTSFNGRSIPDQGPQITLSIVGEKYQQAVDGKVTERGTLKLDASKQPMTIDLAITEGDDSGKAQIGIVEVTDGTLRMCLDTPGAGQRPSEFGVKEGVIVFEARKNEL